MRLGDWLDRRTGYRALLATAVNEPIVGGARWAYVFGSAIAFTIAVQVATGVLLALYYSPSTREAWGSVHYVSHDVTLGWFVRGVHHWGSSAMVILLVAHLVQVFVYGAYRAPREVNWWSGVLLLFVTLAFSLTGYLLPWDQKGYWASRVVTSIVGSLPWIGPWLKGVMQGGNDFGNITLTRFFGFHTFILPAALGAIFLLHLVAFRHHGVTTWPSRKRDSLESKTEPFWPRQVVYDTLFASVVVAVVVAITIGGHGAPLAAPADPASNYPARPEWYFLWLFELLKSVPGGWEGAIILVFGIGAALLLFALPLVDRARTSSLRDRRFVVAVGVLVAGAIAWLTVRSIVGDRRDTGLRAQLREADEAAKKAFALAELGIPPGGTGELYLNDPRESGKHFFTVECAACHSAEGKGGSSAPDLTGYGTRAWTRAIIATPTRPELYGRLTKISGMDPPDATPAEIDLLTDYVLSLGGVGSEPAGGADLFDDKGCHQCHALAGDAPQSGPSLAGYGSKAWIFALVNDAGAPEYFGERNEMPVFRGRITERRLDDMLVYLSSLRRSE